MRLAQLPAAEWSVEADATARDDWRRLATAEAGEQMRVVLAESAALSGGCRYVPSWRAWR